MTKCHKTWWFKQCMRSDKQFLRTSVQLASTLGAVVQSTCSAHVQERYMLLKEGQFLCWRQDARQYGLLVVSLCTMTCMHLLRVQSVYVWEDNTAFCICRKTSLFQNTASAGQESTPTAVPSAPFQGLNRAFARAAKPHSSMSVTDPQGQSPVNGLLSVEATISEIYLTFS